MGDLWTAVSTKKNFEAAKRLVKYDQGSNIEDFLSQCVNAAPYLTQAENKIVTDFVAAAETEIHSKCTSFLKGAAQLPHHETFLRKLTRRRSKAPRPKFFTTNYDLCFEQAAARVGLTVIDGFSYSQPRIFNPNHFGYDLVRRAQSSSETNELVEGVIQLYKLHGSVDWEIEEDRVVQTKSPLPGKRCLIYPASTKYQHSYTQPYLELVSKYLTSLREPNTALIIVGFGFNDDHLSAPILSAIQSNPSLNTLIVDPNIQEKDTDGKLNHTHKRLKTFTDSKVTFVNAYFSQFADLIPDLKALSQEHQLAKNILNLSQRR
ncbi:SIR2 family protein [Pelagicoccus enzymogenes]|uniref:SIR2 family protein n=1 Tax=Pelagicoccus enzymogenes TaxID=2773457 RepID=UPI00280D7D4E|nr:SIR2 family protein [Pelagicoccus enzymogenes]MDQ8198190.1 SIR2 family protein [Pelagicoccus enzymogenes]